MMQKSRYSKTEVSNEFLRYPFNGPVKYDYDYTGTYSKYSIVDKYYVDTLVKPHKRLVSGGAEWSSLGSGLDFTLSPLVYTFTGEMKYTDANLSPIPGTFAPGNATSDRIDAIVIDETGTISIVQGEPAAIPAKPPISDSQILIQYAYIYASAVSIGTSESIYTNNTQWTTSQYQLSGISSGSVDFNNSDDYASGSSVQVDTDYRTGIKFTKPSGLGVTASLYGSLSMRVKFTSVVPDQKSLYAQIQGTANGSAVYGNTVNLMSYGLHREIVGSWQHVVVPTSKFGSGFSLINALTLRMSGGASSSNTLWRVDYIILQQGRSYDGYMGEPDAVGGGGSVVSGAVSGGVIGPAEDGTYTDGVFTDFNPNTPIGTAIDRFNELFLALVPAKAPALSDWSASRSSPSGVNGKLSFDDSNPIAEASYTGANTAPSSAVSVDGTWTSSGKRLGIFASSSTNNLSGTLASNTAVSTSLPTPAYAANSFGDATTGNLTLNINGQIVSTASLTSIAAINNTSGSSVSGFVLSAATSSKFPTGSPFEQFWNRTGTWFVKSNDSRIRNGYNYIIAEHKSTSFTRTLDRVEFIQDHNLVSTTFSAGSITSFSLSGSKYLSGIQYFTGGTVTYDAQISNLYRNTYYSGSDAISFNDSSTTGNAGTNPLLTVSAQYSLVASGGNELKMITLSGDYPGTHVPFNIISSGKRRLNDPIGISTTTKRTLQGTVTGATATISNVYLDNVAASSNSSTTEGFDDEVYRLRSNAAYSLITDVSSGSNAWVSSQSLTNGSSGHTDGLQVYNSTLIYPKINFSTPGALTTNLNYGDTDRDYSSASGNRTYYRYFQFTQLYANYKIIVNGSGGTFVAKSTSITGTNNIWLEMKLPTATGWLDCYTTFAPGVWTDGSGCFASNQGVGSAAAQRAFGGQWGLTTGTKGNYDSGGYVVIRITVSSAFTGQFTGITFAWQ